MLIQNPCYQTQSNEILQIQAAALYETWLENKSTSQIWPENITCSFKCTDILSLSLSGEGAQDHQAWMCWWKRLSITFIFIYDPLIFFFFSSKHHMKPTDLIKTAHRCSNHSQYHVFCALHKGKTQLDLAFVLRIRLNHPDDHFICPCSDHICEDQTAEIIHHSVQECRVLSRSHTAEKTDRSH